MQLLSAFRCRRGRVCLNRAHFQNHLKPDKINHEQVAGSVINRFTEMIYMYCQFVDYYVCKQTIKRKKMDCLDHGKLDDFTRRKKYGAFFLHGKCTQPYVSIFVTGNYSF